MYSTGENQPQCSGRLNKRLSIATDRLTTDKDQPYTTRVQFSNQYSHLLSMIDSTTIESDLSAFNLIEFNSKDNKNIDHSMANAKLKKLQNDAQLKRINMEIDSRAKKLSKSKNAQLTNRLIPRHESYLQTYRDITQRKIRILDENEHSDSEEEDKSHREEGVRGVKFGVELKRYPKLLEYTSEKVHSREKERQDLQQIKSQKLMNFRSQINTITHNEELKRKRLGKKVAKEVNPEQVVDNIYRKLYTKKNKDKTIDQLRQEPRLNQLLDRQDRIVESMDQKSLSKQNHKKMRMKLGQIVGSLYMDTVKAKQCKLPRISNDSAMNASTTGVYFRMNQH